MPNTIALHLDAIVCQTPKESSHCVLIPIDGEFTCIQCNRKYTKNELRQEIENDYNFRVYDLRYKYLQDMEWITQNKNFGIEVLESIKDEKMD